MRNLISDFRHALRNLVAHPSFSIAAVLTLALGIGLTTTIFGVVNGIVLEPLPFPNADRLITVCEQYPAASPDWCSISAPNVEDIAARSRTIEAIGLGRSWPYHLATVDGAESIRGGLATPGLFSALGVHAQLGRLIEPGDLIGRASVVALLTDEMWRTRFGATRDVIGRNILLDGQSVTIVGVLPPHFDPPDIEDVQIWRPLHINPRDEKQRAWQGFVAFARLKPGVTLEGANADLARISAQLHGEHYAPTQSWSLYLEPAKDRVIGQVKPVLLVFLGAVALVLLVACTNVANLLLVRANARRAEIALRSALGASRWRIVRALLVESFVLAIAGALFGVLAASWGTTAFKSLAPASVPRLDDVHVNGVVLAFALALAIATTIIFGLVPALRVARVDLAQAMRDGTRTTSMRGGAGRLLVAGELALALALTFGAVLLAQSFAKLTAWKPGFERGHLLTFSLLAPSEKYGGSGLAGLWRTTEEQLDAVPGVVSAATTSAAPLLGGEEDDELTTEYGGTERSAKGHWLNVSPTYLPTLGVPVVRGRGLSEADVAGAPPVAVINESLAERLWPGADPIGKRVTMFREKLTLQVVGVARDIPPIEPGAPTTPQIYLSNRQEPRGFVYVVVRTALPPASVVSALRARVKEVDRDLDAGQSMRTMTEIVDRRLKRPRFNMLLLVTFGLSALMLAAIGTYGLFAYHTARRTRELGIRIALGASHGMIMRGVMRDGLVLAAIGVAGGALASVALSRVLRGMVSGVSTSDPAALALSACVLVAIALLACLVPARRAARVDPVVTLSAE